MRNMVGTISVGAEQTWLITFVPHLSISLVSQCNSSTPNRSTSKEGVFLMSGLGDVEIVVHGGKVEVSFNMTVGES